MKCCFYATIVPSKKEQENNRKEKGNIIVFFCHHIDHRYLKLYLIIFNYLKIRLLTLFYTFLADVLALATRLDLAVVGASSPFIPATLVSRLASLASCFPCWLLCFAVLTIFPSWPVTALTLASVTTLPRSTSLVLANYDPVLTVAPTFTTLLPF